MKIKTFNLKKNNINVDKIDNCIKIFFKNNKFNSQFVDFSVKITTESRKNEVDLISNISIDVQNYQTKVSFKNLVINSYIKMSTKLKTTKEDKLIIFYKEQI